MMTDEADPVLQGIWLTPAPHLLKIRKNVWQTLNHMAWFDRAMGRTIVVPAGFITDLASIPAALHFLFDRDDPRTIRAAILHDFGYSIKSVGMKQAVDLRFYYGLIQDRFPYARLYYNAVRYFGFYAWNLQRNVPELTAILRDTPNALLKKA